MDFSKKLTSLTDYYKLLVVKGSSIKDIERIKTTGKFESLSDEVEYMVIDYNDTITRSIDPNLLYVYIPGVYLNKFYSYEFLSWGLIEPNTFTKGIVIYNLIQDYIDEFQEFPTNNLQGFLNYVTNRNPKILVRDREVNLFKSHGSFYIHRIPNIDKYLRRTKEIYNKELIISKVFNNNLSFKQKKDNTLIPCRYPEYWDGFEVFLTKEDQNKRLEEICEILYQNTGDYYESLEKKKNGLLKKISKLDKEMEEVINSYLFEKFRIRTILGLEESHE